MVRFCGNGPKFGLFSQFGQNMVRISVKKSEFWDLSVKQWCLQLMKLHMYGSKSSSDMLFMVNQFRYTLRQVLNLSWILWACIDLHLEYSYNIFGTKVRIYPPKDQKKVCLFSKIWSEKSQNFWHFCQNPIVGALT